MYHPLVIFGRRFAVLASLLLSTVMLGAEGFQQDHRINSLLLQFGTDAFAPSNQFGSAFVGSVVRDQFRAALNDEVAAGSISIVLTMPTLTNLLGSNQPSLQIGIADGRPVIASGNPASYSGASDLDWWYILNTNQVDAGGTPVAQMPAAITNSVLVAGPGRLSFGNASKDDVTDVHFRANIGPASAPLASTNNYPPGRRAGENIEPGLQSFATMNSGQAKGKLSAAWLAATPVPSAIVGFGSPAYTAENSMLDLVVGGYTVLFTQQIRATQPDSADPAAPILGAGPPYRFAADPTTRKVNSCRDRLGNPVDLAAGLKTAAYSTYFTFTTDRVITLSPARLEVQQPSGVTLTNGAARSFGTLVFQDMKTLEFVLLNAGLQDLTNVSLSITGPDAAAFTLLTDVTNVVSGGGGTLEVPIRFAPARTAPATATLLITSSDATQTPFHVELSGAATNVPPPTLTNAARLPNGDFRFQFNSHSNVFFMVLITTNLALPLAEWTEIPAWQASPGLFEFIDRTATNYPQRFYRVRSPTQSE
jgi:hypothetical protein